MDIQTQFIQDLLSAIVLTFPKNIFKMIDDFNGRESLLTKRHILAIKLGLSRDYMSAISDEAFYGTKNTLQYLFALVDMNNRSIMVKEKIDYLMTAHKNAFDGDNDDTMDLIYTFIMEYAIPMEYKFIFESALRKEKIKVARYIYNYLVRRKMKPRLSAYLDNACRCRRWKSVQLLLELGANPNAYSGRAFRLTIEANNMEIVKSFIKAGVILKTEYASPIKVAKWNHNNREMIELFVYENKDKSDSNLSSILADLISTKMNDLFYHVMNEKEIKDYDNLKYLEECVKSNNIQILDFLLCNSSNHVERISNISTICRIASEGAKYASIKYLVGRRFMVLDSKCLFNAIEDDNPKLVKFILNHGVRLDDEDRDRLLSIIDFYISDETLNPCGLKSVYDNDEYEWSIISL